MGKEVPVCFCDLTTQSEICSGSKCIVYFMHFTREFDFGIKLIGGNGWLHPHLSSPFVEKKMYDLLIFFPAEKGNENPMGPDLLNNPKSPIVWMETRFVCRGTILLKQNTSA